MKTTELAIVGAGPGGLSAAITAAQAGLQVTLLDEYHQPGGQYLRGALQKDHTPAISRTEARSRKLLEQLPSQNIDLKTGTLVWGIEGHRLALHSALGTEWLTAEKIIIATGARELVTPFPGWTLPGVMTLGAAQILAKEHGVLPGKRILLAGSGPLLLAAASALSKTGSGATVLGVLEATTRSRSGVTWTACERACTMPRPWFGTRYLIVLATQWSALKERTGSTAWLSPR
jgi:NADPH-dependent 2,4-dienoyl-CoA reductase/sulfur reductase-like enzyme